MSLAFAVKECKNRWLCTDLVRCDGAFSIKMPIREHFKMLEYRRVLLSSIDFLEIHLKSIKYID